MSNIFPSFVKKIDNYLLENHPAIWATRVHLHLAIIIPLTIALVGIALLYPVSTTNRDIHWEGFALCLILSIILALYFIYTIALHNADKRQGVRFLFQSRVEFLCYFISIGSTLLIPFLFPMVTNAKYARLMDEQVIIEEINTLNKGRVYFMDNYTDFKYFKNDEQYKHYMNIRSRDYSDAQEYYDSQIKNWYNDALEAEEGNIKLYCTDIQWANLYYYDHSSFQHNILSEDELIAHYLKPKTDEEKLAEINAFIATYKKNEALQRGYRNYRYSAFFPSAEDVLTLHKSNEFTPYYSSTDDDPLNYYNIDNAHDTVMRAKYRFEREWKFVGITLLIISIIIASLLYVFKNIPWRQFVALIILLVLYPVVAGIFEVVGRAEGTLFFFGILALFFFGVVQMFLIPTMKAFSRITAILLGYAGALMPFFPIILLFFTDEVLDVDYFKNPDYNPELGNYERYDYDLKNNVYIGFLWGGVILYATVFTSVLKTAFIRLYALPRKK